MELARGFQNLQEYSCFYDKWNWITVNIWDLSSLSLDQMLRCDWDAHLWRSLFLNFAGNMGFDDCVACSCLCSCVGIWGRRMFCDWFIDKQILRFDSITQSFFSNFGVFVVCASTVSPRILIRFVTILLLLQFSEYGLPKLPNRTIKSLW